MMKRLARGFLSQLFKFSIVLLVLTTALVVVFGKPDRLKSTLKDSGVFNTTVDNVLNQSQKDQNIGDNEIPLDDPAIRAAAKTAFSADFLEQSANQVIDGIYGWLQGKTVEPEFQLNLADAKNRLANAVGDVAVNRVKSLPVCTTAQLLKLDRNNLDPFTLPCRPPGIDLKAERTKLVNQIARNDDFLKDTTITASDLPKKDGQTAFDNANAVPSAYQWSQRLPLILGALAVLSAAGLILLHDDRRRGIWIIGRTLLISGIILCVTALVANYLVAHIQFVKVETGNTAQQTLVSVVRSLINDVNQVIIIMGAVYALAGAILMLAIHFTRPKALPEKSKDLDATDTKAVETSEEPQEPEEVSEKSKIS